MGVGEVEVDHRHGRAFVIGGNRDCRPLDIEGGRPRSARRRLAVADLPGQPRQGRIDRAGRRRCRVLRYNGGIISSSAQTERPGDAWAGGLTSPAGSREIHGSVVHCAQLVWQGCSRLDFPEVIDPITAAGRATQILPTGQGEVALSPILSLAAFVASPSLGPTPSNVRRHRFYWTPPSRLL